VHSETDRDTSRADRRSGAGERSRAELDRDTAFVDRRAGAEERSHAFDDRDTAQADRTAGACERFFARGDRDTSLADRGASATDREHLSFDDLTGVYRRRPGFLEFEREMSRVRRVNEPFVLAFIDVDHLKAVNDSHGSRRRRSTARRCRRSLRATLRPYDLIIRYGGDEFVWAIAGLSPAAVTTRLSW